MREHATEIIAWGNGGIIQYYCDRYGEWVDCGNNHPAWVTGTKYRVKPVRDSEALLKQAMHDIQRLQGEKATQANIIKELSSNNEELESKSKEYSQLSGLFVLLEVKVKNYGFANITLTKEAVKMNARLREMKALANYNDNVIIELKKLNANQRTSIYNYQKEVEELEKTQSVKQAKTCHK